MGDCIHQYDSYLLWKQGLHSILSISLSVRISIYPVHCNRTEWRRSTLESTNRPFSSDFALMWRGITYPKYLYTPFKIWKIQKSRYKIYVSWFSCISITVRVETYSIQWYIKHVKLISYLESIYNNCQIKNNSYAVKGVSYHMHLNYKVWV